MADRKTGRTPPGSRGGAPPTRDIGTARSLLTTGSIVERNKYKIPTDPKLREPITALRTYLDEKGIEQVYNRFLALVLSRQDLPYNPYTGFVRRLRVSAEKFHMSQSTPDQITRKLACRYRETHVAHIVRVTEGAHIWALPSIARVLNPAALRRFDWLLHDLVPRPDVLQKVKGYSNQWLVALVGPAVFYGGVLQFMHSVDIRIEVVITGPEIKTGVRMFADDVIKDVLTMDEETKHLVLGVTLATREQPGGDKWKNRFWTKEMLQEQRDNFAKNVSEAIVANKLINLECLYCLDPETREYMRGQKQFSLNFIREAQGPGGGKEELHYFSDFALLTLHEGVFMMQAHAEGYLSAFTAHLQIINKEKEGDTQEPPQDEVDDFGFLGVGSSTSSHKAVGKNDSGTSPFAWQVTAPIKSEWQQRVAALDPIQDVYEIGYYLLLLALIDKNAYDPDVIRELYWLHHSTGAQLHGMMQTNKALRQLTLKFSANTRHEVLRAVYASHLEEVKDLFNSQLQERSSDMRVFGETLCRCLEDILGFQDSQTQLTQIQRKSVATVLHTAPVKVWVNGIQVTLTQETKDNDGQKTLEVLKNMHSYMTSVLTQLAEDAIFWCAYVKSSANTLQTVHADRVPRISTAARDRAKGRTGVKAGEGDTLCTHGIEHERNHDRLVINVDMCMQRDNAPKVVGMESVLLKYILDTRLDEVWIDFVMSLVAAERFPPNPYPRLVTLLRQCVARMDLCFEPEEKTQKELLHSAMRCADQTNRVYHIPGCEAFGDEVALCLLDSTAWFDVAKVVQPVISSSLQGKNGAYKVRIAGSVTGAALYHGRLDPYLTEVTLYEHCYIKGPDGCSGEAVQLYTKIIFEEFYKKLRSGEWVVTGAFLGHEQVKWTTGEIFIERRKAFVYEFERLLEVKEPIYIKIYVKKDWGYVPLLKYFKFHFLNEQHTDLREFYPHNASDHYRQLFFDKEQAVFHNQASPDIHSRDPHSATRLAEATECLEEEALAAAARSDWLNVYRLLLQRASVNKGTSLVIEAWRLFHSMGRQVDYVITLGRSLQDLVRFMIDKQKMGLTGPAQAPPTPPASKGKKKKKNEPESNDVMVDPVEADMSKMTVAFRQKLEVVLSSPRFLSARALNPLLLNKLKSITERDEVTRELFLVIALLTIMVLEEICQMLTPYRDALLSDVHSINPRAQAALAALRAEAGWNEAVGQDGFDENDDGLHSARPESTASEVLDRYSGMRVHPQAVVTDFADMWTD